MITFTQELNISVKMEIQVKISGGLSVATDYQINHNSKKIAKQFGYHNIWHLKRMMILNVNNQKT